MRDMRERANDEEIKSMPRKWKRKSQEKQYRKTKTHRSPCPRNLWALNRDLSLKRQKWIGIYVDKGKVTLTCRCGEAQTNFKHKSDFIRISLRYGCCYKYFAHLILHSRNITPFSFFLSYIYPSSFYLGLCPSSPRGRTFSSTPA